MAKTHPTTMGGWLTLQDASKQLGVSRATLRQWADKGKVHAFRTPGGHRRFSQLEMRSLVSADNSPRPTLDLDRLIHSALGRARLEIGSGRLEREPWHRSFDNAAKQLHRELGHRLMTLLLQALHEESGKPGVTRRARYLGKEYGRASLRQGTSLPDSLRAFLFFRDYVFEDLIDLASRSATNENLRSLDAYRRLSAVVNAMLVAMVETYSEQIIHSKVQRTH